MTKSIYEKENLWWHIGKTQQMLSEWWEKQTYDIKDTFKGWSLPEWLFDFLWESAKFISWTLVACLLAWIVWKSSPLLRNYIADLLRKTKPQKSKERIKNIPTISPATWWQKAQQFQMAGNYTEAIFCLYSGLLQQLNDRGIAVDLSSRTDGEYLSIVDRLTKSSAYRLLFSVHQELCFGDVKADSNLWQRCSQAYQDLERD